MLLTPDLQTANGFEKRLNLSLGPDILTPVYSYLSMTERSEYTTTEAEYSAETLEKERGLTAGTPEFDAALEEFRTRMEKYGKDRLYPKLGNRPVLCFYSMGMQGVLSSHVVSPSGSTRVILCIFSLQQI